jgi:hypothetical protein
MVQWINARAPRRAGFGDRVWAVFSALLLRPEPVEMVEQCFNFLPRTFRWRGDVWRVRSVVRVWDRPRAGIRPPRRYFEVTCGQSGSYILIHDLHVGIWHLSV